MAQAEANAKALKTGILPCFLKPNTISLRDYQLILCMLEYLNLKYLNFLDEGGLATLGGLEDILGGLLGGGVRKKTEPLGGGGT